MCYSNVSIKNVLLFVHGSNTHSLWSNVETIQLINSPLNDWENLTFYRLLELRIHTIKQDDQLPVAFLAQLVERRTVIEEVMGSTPAQACIIFRLDFHHCIGNVFSCDDHSHIRWIVVCTSPYSLIPCHSAGRSMKLKFLSSLHPSPIPSPLISWQIFTGIFQLGGASKVTNLCPPLYFLIVGYPQVSQDPLPP